jgi:putative PIN family toxin of toxin-antitoxin system
MIKVVLNANRFVSALLKPASNSAQLLDLVHAGKIRLLVSKRIIAEIESVIRYPKIKKIHRRSDSNLNAFIIKIIRTSQMVSGRLSLQAIKDDPTDDKYLECAIEGEADYIVSGDKHLKDLN